jgi:nucleoside phosphorylase
MIELQPAMGDCNAARNPHRLRPDSLMSNEIDILLYVALVEEFSLMKPMLGSGFTRRELHNFSLTGFFGTIASPVLGKDFRVGIVPAGTMGITSAATIVSALIAEFRPADIVVLGIAGSLSNDMEPGDVFIPSSINEYLANAATRGEQGSWTFDTSGKNFRTSGRLLNRFQLFVTEEDDHARWLDETKRHRKTIIKPSTEEALLAANLQMRGECKLFAGDDLKLASGPAVGKGKAFVTWLTREVDRKVAAMEMESAGVYDAATVRIPAPRTIAIRGISDYADERKDKIEATAKGLFRKLAVTNAFSLLITGIKAGFFAPERSSPLTTVVSAEVNASETRVKSIYVIGGVTGESGNEANESAALNTAAYDLGKHLADSGAQLVVCSPFPDVADHYAIRGYAESKANGVIQIHSPDHPDVAKQRRDLKGLERDGLKIQDWKYPGPEDKDSWPQAWLLAQLQALEHADAVVALGGKVSKSANTLLHLAEGKGLPIIPFVFLGGAARRAFDRRDWKSLNPGFDTSILQQRKGIEKTIEIANRLVIDRVARSAGSTQKPEKVFLSFAHQDSTLARSLEAFLKEQGIEVLIGDDQARTDQMLTASIEQAFLKSDVCVVFWSRNYALSPWCFNELNLAISQQSYGRMKLWLFNLDDSAIVPTDARKLPAISVRSREAIRRVASELLAQSERETQ